MNLHALLILVLVLALTSCNASSGGQSPSETVCRDEDVVAYLDGLEALLEKWSDTEARALVSSKIALGTVVGELQEVRREVKSLTQPACTKVLRDSTVIAMDHTIDMFLAFMASPDDIEVSWISEAADTVWESVESQLEDARQNGIDPDATPSLDVLTVDRDAPVTPEGWQEVEVAGSELRVSIPSDWTDIDEDTEIDLTSPDGKIDAFVSADDETLESLIVGEGDYLSRLNTNAEKMAEGGYYYVRESRSLHWDEYDVHLVRFTMRQLTSPTDIVLAVVVVEENPVLAIAAFTGFDTILLEPEAFDVLNGILNSLRVD